MIHPVVSYYSAAKEAEAGETDQLILEIGSSEIACIVKNRDTQQITAFELFQLDKGSNDWSDVFFELRTSSNIINHSFRQTECYFNFEEAVIMPEQKFSITAAEDYLALLFGEKNSFEIKYDTLAGKESMVNAYRVKKTIHEWIERHVILYQPHHIYSRILADLLAKELPEGFFVNIRFYSRHFILTVFKDGKLQLIQTFHYTALEDILYHVMNTIQQLHIGDTTSALEISGMLDPEAAIYQQLAKLFTATSIESIDTDALTAFTHQGYPLHYFTPYFKLTV